MSKLFVINTCLVLYVFCCSEAQVAADENGGYGVLVSFSQNVKYEDGKRLLETFRETLQNSSAILREAIGRTFTTVTFKIPHSWDVSEWGIATGDSATVVDAQADFVIDDTSDAVFGKFPFAQQYGSCGTPGHQIAIPSEFLSAANDFPAGLALAREWLKYRYGVFDENGLVGDPLYPAHYIQPGGDAKEVKVTDCTNSPVVYNFKDQSSADCAADDPDSVKRLEAGDCSAIPDQESLENVTSSFMYFHKDIVSMQHVCGKEDGHQHNAMSPNKQNAMCRGQSVWDTIKSSKGFQDVTTTDDPEEIKYFYVRESRPRVVVAWENTLNINSAKMGAVILKSIKRLVYDLPDESKFCGFPFSSILSQNKDYTLRTLSTTKEKNVVIPAILSDFIRDENGDVNLAINRALDILSSDGNSPQPVGNIIIITTSNVQRDSAVLERLQRHPKVCVLLLYLGGDPVPEDVGNFVNSLPCHSLKFINTTARKEEDLFADLFSSMELVLPETVDDKRTETVKTGFLTKDSSISFDIDETIETLTFWVFTDKESENFKLKFNQNDQELTTTESTAIMALTFSPPEAGRVEFSYPYDTSSILTQIRSTSKAGMYLTGRVFIHDTTDDSSDSHQMPVIIYAMIRFGSYPVQGAVVVASVQTPDGENISFQLLDDGRGDPDITRNDGVYSRYFTQFTEKGDYIVTVVVATVDVASYGKDENAGYQTCCGSFVKAATSTLPKLSKLLHTSFRAKSGRPEEGYKPARVLDLRVDSAADDKVVLKWSAPGGEGDTGTASRYEIALYCGEDNSTDCNVNESIRVLDLPPPASLGRVQEATVQILTKTHILSVGIISYNEKNKSSDLSNMVQIKGIAETTTVGPEATPILQDTTSKIIFSVFISLALVCLLAGIACFFKRKSGRNKRRKNSSNLQSVDIADHIKPVVATPAPAEKTASMKRVESFPVLLYTHNQIKDRRDSEKHPPLYKTDVPPKPWASLDAVTGAKAADWARDTKSLGSTSTVDATDEFEIKEIKSDSSQRDGMHAPDGK